MSALESSSTDNRMAVVLCCFDYNDKSGNERQDLSFRGWNYQALKAAHGAGLSRVGFAGCDIQRHRQHSQGIDCLKKISADGEFCYTTSNNDPQSKKAEGRHSMRAVGVLCLQLFGEGIARRLRMICRRSQRFPCD